MAKKPRQASPAVNQPVKGGEHSFWTTDLLGNIYIDIHVSQQELQYCTLGTRAYLYLQTNVYVIHLQQAVLSLRQLSFLVVSADAQVLMEFIK